MRFFVFERIAREHVAASGTFALLKNLADARVERFDGIAPGLYVTVVKPMSSPTWFAGPPACTAARTAFALRAIALRMLS